MDILNHPQANASLFLGPRDDGARSLITPPLSDHRKREVDQAFQEFLQPGFLHLEIAETLPASRSPSDIVFVTSDYANFHAHSQVLLNVSHNAFNHILAVPSLRGVDKPKSTGSGYFGSKPIFSVPETSMVFNAIIHAIYGVSCAHHHIPFDALVEAVGALQKYGIKFTDVLTPSSSLCDMLLSHAPARAFDVYALASQHNLHGLAVAASAHLCAFPLYDLTDEMAERVGAVYLKKLFLLHLGRIEALKGLVFPPPHPHASAPGCGLEKREAVSRAWSLAAVNLTMDANVDLKESGIRTAFRPLTYDLACNLCRATIAVRVDVLNLRWSMVKNTII